MRKIELAQELAVSEKLHLSTAVKALDGVIRIIKDTLAKGEDITLRGFGTLSVVEAKEHIGHHFQTQEPVVIPARNVVKFRLSKELREMINNPR